MSSSDHVHRAQFQENAEQDIAREVEAAGIADHARRGGTFYHGKQGGPGWEGGVLTPRRGLHVGSKRQAVERLGLASAGYGETPIYDVEVTPRNPYMPEGKVHVESGSYDSQALIHGFGGRHEKLIEAGHDVVPYRNWVEEEGALSYIILDPSSVKVNPVAEWGRRDENKVIRTSPFIVNDRIVTGRRPALGFPSV